MKPHTPLLWQFYRLSHRNPPRVNKVTKQFREIGGESLSFRPSERVHWRKADSRQLSKDRWDIDRGLEQLPKTGRRKSKAGRFCGLLPEIGGESVVGIMKQVQTSLWRALVTASLYLGLKQWGSRWRPWNWEKGVELTKRNSRDGKNNRITSCCIKLNETAGNVHEELGMYLSGEICAWRVQDPKINPSTPGEKKRIRKCEELDLWVRAGRKEK